MMIMNNNAFGGGTEVRVILTHDVCYQARRSQTLDETSTEVFGRLCVRMCEDNVDIAAFRLSPTVPGERGFP
jgi:hypothetical protein